MEPFQDIMRTAAGIVEKYDTSLGKVNVVRRWGFKKDLVSFLDDEGELRTIPIDHIHGRVRPKYSDGRFSSLYVLAPEELDEAVGATEPRMYIKTDKFVGIPPFINLWKLWTHVLEYNPSTRELREVHCIPEKIDDVVLPNDLVAKVVREENRNLVSIEGNGETLIKVPGILCGMEFEAEKQQLRITSIESYDVIGEHIQTYWDYDLNMQLVDEFTNDYRCPDWH